MKEILLYRTDNAEVKVEILLQNENLWLTQAKMAELFDVQKAAISKHLKNVFADGELNKKVVVSKMETTTPHGAMVGKEQTKFVNIYNLDAAQTTALTAKLRRISSQQCRTRCITL